MHLFKSLGILCFCLAASVVHAQTGHLTAPEAKNHTGEKAPACGKVESPRFASNSRGQQTFLNLDEPNPVTIQLVNPKHRPECRFPCQNRRALIFVHGLWGSETTWKYPRAEKSWPELISEDSFFDDFDVYLACYPTAFGFNHAGNKVRLTEVGRGLYERLSENFIDSYKSIHLVGHSLGGNVILTSVLFLKFSNPNAHSVLNKYRNIILLGTPVEGAAISHLADLVSNDEKLIALKPAVENELPVLVEFAFASIQGKRRFLGLEPLLISAAYEEKPYKIYGSLHTREVIVSQSSATAISTNREITTKGFDRDHSTLVKPKDTDDEVYKWVRQQIQLGITSSH
jgi:pimeloyl-ACP methyl ester carboxylesterase